MAKKKTNKKNKQRKPKPEKKKARAHAGAFPVYCQHDAIMDIEKLVPNPKNPNTHDSKQIELLARIIRGQGWRAPVTVSQRSGFIVRGHGRLQAARLLNTTHVPVEYQAYASEAEEHADMIADNKIAELANINKKQLKQLVGEIKDASFDITLLGMDSQELLKLTTTANTTHSPEPEKPKKAITKRGDLWELGKNRLLCGDSTKPEDVKKLMGGRRAHLLFTDPPYGVDYGENTKAVNKNQGKKKKPSKIKNDDLKDNTLINKLLLPAFKQAVLFTKDTAAFFIWHATATKADFDWAIKAAGLEEKQVIIWPKDTFALGRADYHWKHEPCIYAQKSGHKARYVGNRDQSTVWEIQVGGKNKGEFAIANGIRLSQESGQELYIKKGPPKNVKSKTPNPTIDIMAARLPRQPTVNRSWRSAA